MNLEPFQVLLTLLTLISIVFGIRGHLKSYQREDSTRATDTALFTERIATINVRLETMSNRLAEVEKTQEEVHILRVQMATIGEDMKTIKQNVDNIVKLLLERLNTRP